MTVLHNLIDTVSSRQIWSAPFRAISTAPAITFLDPGERTKGQSRQWAGSDEWELQQAAVRSPATPTTPAQDVNVRCGRQGQGRKPLRSEEEDGGGRQTHIPRKTRTLRGVVHSSASPPWSFPRRTASRSRSPSGWVYILPRTTSKQSLPLHGTWQTTLVRLGRSDVTAVFTYVGNP